MIEKEPNLGYFSPALLIILFPSNKWLLTRDFIV